MIRFLFAAVACAMPVAAAAKSLNGNYTYAGSTCRDYPVIISATRLNMGHVQCSFSNPVAVKDMNAELRDAACLVEDVPETTRYFITTYGTGVMIFSPELGLEVLVRCD